MKNEIISINCCHFSYCILKSDPITLGSNKNVGIFEIFWLFIQCYSPMKILQIVEHAAQLPTSSSSVRLSNLNLDIRNIV